MHPTRRTFLQLLGLTGVAAAIPSLDTLEALAPGAQLSLDTDSLPFYLIGVQVVTDGPALVEICADGVPFMYLTTCERMVSGWYAAHTGGRHLRGYLTVRAMRPRSKQPCSVYATLTTVDAATMLRGTIAEIIAAKKATHLIFSEVA